MAAPGTPSPAPARGLTARVAGIRRTSGAITLLHLAAKGERPFPFQAGQYLRLRFGDLPARDYSIASRPDEALLEFHIRDTGDGGASSYVSETLKEGDEVGLEGPFGSCTLRDDLDRPLLAVAGGSGLAPMKSIVETALSRGFRQDVHLYFGARETRDLYLERHFAELAARQPRFHYQSVLSEEPAANGHRQGLVTEAISQDFETLTSFSAYLAGPPAMVETAETLLLGLGLPPRHLFREGASARPRAKA